MSGKEVVPASGFFHELALRIKLIMRLMQDRRINPLLKLLPLGTLVYLISPLDFIPLNPLDDAGILGLGFYLFIELCPPDVVQEHLDDMRRVIPGEWRDITEEDSKGN